MHKYSKYTKALIDHKKSLKTTNEYVHCKINLTSVKIFYCLVEMLIGAVKLIVAFYIH